MSKKDKSKEKEIKKEILDETVAQEEQTNEIGEQETPVTEEQETCKEETLKIQLDEMNDKYIRLVAEFDNYKRRTLRERIELIKTAGEDILKDILPVIDDIERAIQNIDQSKDIEAVKTGINLIYSKLIDFMKQNGVTAIETIDNEFDIDKHEAVTKIPAPSEDMKGKIVDVIKKGYILNDKVIRYSQVVIGE
ncbi:MAG TPA: nucleotide exchange factor GrpE [Salinivirgaceae bacterium]|nr:nucleotide exchange factor GrpE [Salinivirgaceae bacterium]HQA76315.1 nucleotide exchange factor GrpE [Salinivirgaceae bacterium]